MNELSYTNAFAHYGAKLTNYVWSVSAFGRGPCLVVSLYQNWIRKGDAPDTLVYRDVLSAWKGNSPGRNELREHLQMAKESNIS